MLDNTPIIVQCQFAFCNRNRKNRQLKEVLSGLKSCVWFDHEQKIDILKLCPSEFGFEKEQIWFWKKRHRCCVLHTWYRVWFVSSGIQWKREKKIAAEQRNIPKNESTQIHTLIYKKKERKEKRAEWPHLGSFIFSLNSLVKMPIQTINSVVDEMSVWASEWIRLVWKQKRRRRWSES